MGKLTKSQYLAQEWIIQFSTFPDTGSATTLIASNLAEKYNIQSAKPPTTKYVSVNGDPVPTTGTAMISLGTSSCSVQSTAIITTAIRNEIIMGHEDLKKLGIISKQFPNPIFIVPENHYSNIRESLIKDNPDVLTDDLPNNSMDTGCVSMKIHLTPGEITPFCISTARQIPLHWREKAERIVKKLFDSSVIKQEENPMEWCAPGFFVAKKNGDLRLVIDYTRFTHFLQRRKYYQELIRNQKYSRSLMLHKDIIRSR